MYLEEVLPEFRKGAKIRSVLWGRGQYLRYDAKTRDIINEEGVTYDITGWHLSDNQWEFYQEPIDWDYIIKNKCLCWFWDDNFKEGAIISCLKSRGNEFLDVCNWVWSHCRPVRRDEVTFYEDII